MSASRERYRRYGGGLAAWSVGHPVGVSMITLALVVLGMFAFRGLEVDLLPHIIYPEVRVRVIDPGVPAQIMEDRITRQLEEQLAITEGANAVRSRSQEGNSSVDLAFPYGTDIDIALRDASARLDRAQRFLPDTIDPPIIYKRDPSQIAVAEFVVSSTRRDAVEMRSWVDDVFSKWFITLPGVAAVEVGGGLIREIHVLPDLPRLAAFGLELDDLTQAIQAANLDQPGGRLHTGQREFSSRTAGRFTKLSELNALELALPGGGSIPLSEVAEVRDTHEDERLRVRLNGTAGIKVSIQKQPSANTVGVVDAVRTQLMLLSRQGLMPDDIEVRDVRDQSIYVRHSLRNAAMAALGGGILAMIVVFVFLGDVRRTLLIGTAIPIAIAVTFALMAAGGLTLNIMTLGGLAVGIGMLVDSTIVMLENIVRHQHEGESGPEAGVHAASEVNSAIVASTSTNLAAILPFLFVGGLTGLLFRELIFTVSAAIFASMLVALTLVPALAARLRVQSRPGLLRRLFDRGMHVLQRAYARLLGAVLHRLGVQLLIAAGFIALFVIFVPPFKDGRQLFLPNMDEGRVRVSITADPGIELARLDEGVRLIEQALIADEQVEDTFVISGGFIFGRTQREFSNRASMNVALKPDALGEFNSDSWIARMSKQLDAIKPVDFRIRMSVQSVPGLRISEGDEEVTLRLLGPDLDTLQQLGSELAERLEGTPGLRNISWSGEEVRLELALRIDRERAAELGVSVEEIGRLLTVALEGRVISDYIEGDRMYDIRLRLPAPHDAAIPALQELVVRADSERRVHLGEVAQVELLASPSEILRSQQQRMVEVTASIRGDTSLSEAADAIQTRIKDLQLPAGYSLYDAGAAARLQQGRDTGLALLGLALFLVFTVMAVQYESLRNPLVILCGVPFAAIGVAIGLPAMNVPLSMPVWLGLIMLTGIVVNNAIVLVEYIESLQEQDIPLHAAIVKAARLRLRPILMTTLTTLLGLSPLAAGLGAGSEMLQPLALTMLTGLAFSILVSLLLIPILYSWFHRNSLQRNAVDAISVHPVKGESP